MAPHNRRLKLITLAIDGDQYECQITNWKINPPANVVGDKGYTYCPDGEYREETDPEDWTVDLTWLTDWRANGLDRVLWANQGDTVTFVLRNHPDITGEAAEWSGSVILQAPAAGGDARATETSEITLIGVGDVPLPSYPVVP